MNLTESMLNAVNNRGFLIVLENALNDLNNFIPVSESKDMNVDDFNWDEIFKPLTKKEEGKYEAEVIKKEKEDIANKKETHFKKIKASGKNWNDATLLRIKSVKQSLVDLKNAIETGGDVSAEYAYGMEYLESLAEMGWGAKKYAENLRKKLDEVYKTIYK